MDVRLVGLPDDCPALDAATVACTPGTPGQYEVRVVATDSTGTNSTASFVFTVAPTLLGLPQLEGVGLLVLVVGLVALAMGILLRRSRRPPNRRSIAAPERPPT